MSVHHTYAVFGLGRYGRAVAAELIKSGAEVLGVDKLESAVDEAIDEIPICKCADVTDPDVIDQLGIAAMDVVIIAMADNLEASVLATTLCKEAGVKNVVVKCASEMHRKILRLVGADQVVFPEHDSGVRLAKNLISSGFVDLIDLSDNVSMVELDVRPEWEGKTLMDLDLRKKYGTNVVAIRHDGQVLINVDPSMPLEKGMVLIVIAYTNTLRKLQKK